MIITISATPGAGKHDVARSVAERLGFRYVSMTDVRRRLARDRDVTEEELVAGGENEFWTDREVDEHLEEIAASFENMVVASRFGFTLIPHSFKVFLSCDPLIAAQRLRSSGEERYGVSFDEVVESIRSRISSDRERGLSFYRIDPHDPSHFDLVLDISRLNREQTVDVLTSSIGRLRNSWSLEPERI